MKSLVIVESPTKAKTIRKFLPKEYVVDSSMGHIRDLPASAKEIPAKYKKQKWSTIGIDVDNNFEPIYVISSGKKKVVDKLKKQLRDVDELILATDEDREGEGISWHLVEVLKPKVPVKRMVFHEITNEAIQEALSKFREIDMNLVQAQEARRFVDRLAGYTISPVLWKKISPGLSAGRVQSAAVELLVQRERDRIRFKGGFYWDLEAKLQKENQKPEFLAKLFSLNGTKIAAGKDFDSETGNLKKPQGLHLLTEVEAIQLKSDFSKGEWRVSSVEKKRQKRSPSPPFITSTLQQEANRKFGFSARDTMRIAQKLYENGLITYMRTDSTNLSGQAINAARESIKEQYGENYLFKTVRQYGKKVKGAQEAHEAIRPAGNHFKLPEKTGLSGREFKLYDLIWKRTMATQMADAELEFTNIDITCRNGDTQGLFKATGKKILFPGFFRAYVEGSDNPDEAIENQESLLPELAKGDSDIKPRSIEAKGHETKPPARFTEASLVKMLEKEGVGRPSTYASILSTIIDRGYVLKDGNALIPTLMAFAVTGLLEKYFPDLVDLQFTSEMENQLDEIATGDKDWIDYLRSFYKGECGLETQVNRQESNIDPQEAKKIDLPLEGLGKMEIFVGRYGPYVQLEDNGERKSASLSPETVPEDLTPDKLKKVIMQSDEVPASLGKDPETGADVLALTGRFGPYVQLGEVTDENKKPKRTSLLKGMKLEDVDLDMALKLLSLPRKLGVHPETTKAVNAGVGRYGPYVVHDGVFASLTKDDSVLDIDLDRAIELLTLARSKKKSATSGEIKSLGNHPSDDNEIKVMTGRYGPYLKYGKTNVSIPKSIAPEEITLEQAAKLIEEKRLKANR